jgi:hypothetical protein
MSKLQGYSNACALAVLWTTAAVVQPTYLSTLSSFAKTNSAFPLSTLLLATDGNLYGATQNGGKHARCVSGSRYGTVFQMTMRGKLIAMASFDGANSALPFRGFIQGPDGTL